jgi:arylsulfatase A-like enzyme
MARFFAEAVAALNELHAESNLVWIHCPGLIAPWDAPFEFRTRFLGEDDPDPLLNSDPPSILKSDDPDVRFAFECAYAGQVTLLDVMLDAFLQSVDAISGETLFILAGLRGFPLGQHRLFGVSHEELQPELTHVPIFARYPPSSNSSRFENHFRVSWLVQPGDIFATVASWLGIQTGFDNNVDLGQCLEEPNLGGRKIAVAVNETELAIRTRHWYARCFDSPDFNDQAKPWCQLYLKPDDRWNANEVSSRCPQVVADLKSFYETCRDSCARGELDEELVPASLLTPPA